jgi:DNA-binding FadR family transcriptional regulator
MDDELIQGQVVAVRIACRRITVQRLEALHHSVEQACLLPVRFGWDRKAAAHAEIFNMLADAVRDRVLRQILNSGVGLVHHLMLAAGPAADGVVGASRRHMLARLRAGDPDGAAAELESELRTLYFMSRLANPCRVGSNSGEGAVA